MKKLLTLRNVLVCGGALFALVAFILAAACGAKVTYNGWGGESDVLYQGAVFGSGSRGAAVLPLIGAILIMVGLVCALVIALFGDRFLKDEKIRMIALLVAAGLIVLGGVFLFFIKDGLAEARAKEIGYNTTKADVLSTWSHGTFEAAGIVIGGVLAVLGGLSICCSQFVKDKQLLK